MPIDISYFISELASLDIVSEQKLKPFIDKKSTYSTGEALAKDLIKTGLLTKYQAEQILSGKGKNLRMGKYLIETKLGAGGMGQVFKAQHAGMGRTVAIKVIHTKNRLDTQAIQRFDREVKAAARLIHPNVITVFDADHENGLHYMVMEYCEGKDLAALISQQGTLGLKDAVDYITQAARGLQYAHEQGVIHRDIKPGNLLVDKSKKVKVVDMGLARLQSLNEEEKVPMLTATNAIMGTFDFMSPEQGLSTRQADARSDIYSLGASLYFLLTGKVMYEGETAFAKLIAHREKPVPKLKLTRPDIPDALETIYQKMVAKNVEDRYQTISEIIIDLASLIIAEEPDTINHTPSVNIKKSELRFTFKPAELGLTKVIKGKETSKQEPFKFSYKHLTYISGTLSVLIIVIWLFLPEKKKHVNPIQNRIPEITETRMNPQKSTSLKKAVSDIASIDFKKENLFLVAPFSEAKAKEVQNSLAKKLGVAVETKIPLGNGVDLEMVLIPPGKFMMGSSLTESNREINQLLHEVIISKPFYLGKYEVTQEQWVSIISKNPSANLGPKLPVENISWNNCQEFITKLNKKTDGGFLLPSEAEWEFSCRAGTVSNFYFGNKIQPEDANFLESNIGKTSIATNYKPNAFGLHNMHGNLWEWCSDWYGDYIVDDIIDPLGPKTGDRRVLRGGSYGLPAYKHSSAMRGFKDPNLHNEFGGIRLCSRKFSD